MERFLVAVDNSPYLEKVLQYLSVNIGGRPDAELVLFHIRQSCISVEELLEDDVDRDILLQKIEEMKRNKTHCRAEQARIEEKIVDRALKALAGIDKKRIRTEFVDEAGEYAQMIINKARELGCRTVVLGKKGDSIISEYLIGSTAEKVSRMARGITIWLVD